MALSFVAARETHLAIESSLLAGADEASAVHSTTRQASWVLLSRSLSITVLSRDHAPEAARREGVARRERPADPGLPAGDTMAWRGSHTCPYGMGLCAR